jgi:hypothetical protein
MSCSRAAYSVRVCMVWPVRVVVGHVPRRWSDAHAPSHECFACTVFAPLAPTPNYSTIQAPTSPTSHATIHPSDNPRRCHPSTSRPAYKQTRTYAQHFWQPNWGTRHPHNMLPSIFWCRNMSFLYLCLRPLTSSFRLAMPTPLSISRATMQPLH